MKLHHTLGFILAVAGCGTTPGIENHESGGSGRPYTLVLLDAPDLPPQMCSSERTARASARTC